MGGNRVCRENEPAMAAGTAATDSLGLLIQLTAGFLLSILGYTAVSNSSLKFYMRVYFGLVAGTLFLIGGFTILSSLFGL